MLEHSETRLVTFSVSEINYVIGNVYRPSKSNNDELISDFSKILNNALTDILNSILYKKGDFNYELFSFNSNNRCMGFYLLFTSLGFFPTITRPTGVSSSSNTSIGNVWTNNIGAFKNIGVIQSGISDHYTILDNQYLINELLDTHVTNKVRTRKKHATTNSVHYYLR